jgi:uncharacterized protein GlcG (DUF336 family)
MSRLTLEQASTIADAALAAGKAANLAPLTVAVLDDGGHLKVFKKEDGASVMRYEIAVGKAWGAIGFGKPTRVLAGIAEERPAFMNAIVAASGGRLIPVPGGVLIRDATGDVIGSVGVTGDTSDNDEVAAVAGIEAAGLTAVTS